MGNFFSSLWLLFKPSKSYKLLILGLNNAGKTTILYQLQLGHCIQTQPTLGGNTEKLSIPDPKNREGGNSINFICWDLGGQEQLRDSWSYYYENTDALIFVVDSTDTSRFPTAKKVLHKLLNEEPLLKNAVLLVFANKQDLENSEAPEVLMEMLELGTLKDRAWTLMGCSAATGESLKDGLNWLAEHLNES